MEEQGNKILSELYVKLRVIVDGKEIATITDEEVTVADGVEIALTPSQD